MTIGPDDVDAIRAKHKHCGQCEHNRILDALEAAWAERDEIIESYRELRDKCNDAYLQRDVWQVRANTAEAKAGEWRAASFAVDAQLRHAQTERDTLNVDAKAWLDNCRKERERAERLQQENEELRRELGR